VCPFALLRFEGSGSTKGKRGNPPLNHRQTIKLAHCFSLYQRAFEGVRKGPFLEGHLVQMFKERGAVATEPARVIAVLEERRDDQAVYCVEVDDPLGGKSDVLVLKCKGHWLRHREPDLSRDERWVQFLCTTCGLSGGSKEVGRR